MKKALVVNDVDGHCSVFDISTEEKRKTVYADMAQGFLEHGNGNWTAEMINKELGDQFRQAIEDGCVDAMLKLFEEIDIHFDRSGGGKLYEVEVQDTFDKTLCQDIL